MGFENSLFDEKDLNEKIKNIEVSQKDKEFIKSWILKLKSKKLDKEKENYDIFQKDFLEKIFGFELLKNLKRDKKINGKKEVEFCFINDKCEVISFIELKGYENKNLQKKQGTGYSNSPIEQADNYSQHIIGKYYFVSNYCVFYLFDKEKRTNKSLKLNFLEFEEENFLQFKILKYFLNPNFIFNQNEEKIETIKIDTKKQDISKEFYSLYRETLFSLVEKIILENKIERIKAVEISQKVLNRIIFICFARDKNFLKNGFLQNIILNSLREKNIFKKIENTFDLLYTREKDNLTEKYVIPNFNGNFFEKISVPLILENKDTQEEKKEFEKIPKAKISKKILNEYNKHKIELDDFSIIFQNFFKIALYNFQSDLNVNILGHIFENSLNDIENLREEKINIRKKDGIFYTPEYITDYICRNTIIPHLSKKSYCEVDKLIEEYKNNLEELEKKLENIKILDPACGSGAFLNKAVDILQEIWEKILDEKKLNPKDVILKSGKKNISSKIYTLENENLENFEKRASIKNIIKNNIFGVDLNYESCEISKLSLHLKTLNENNLKLENLENNIKCGNSLISGINEKNFKLFEEDLKNILLEKNKDEKEDLKKDLKRKVDKNLKDYFGENYKEVKPFNWEIEFIEIFFKIENKILIRKGFDVVIGNPPYVRHELIKEYKKYFEKNYKVFQGTADLCVYFFERSLNNLVENGKFSFIVSNKFTRANYGKNLRNYILNNTKFLQYIDEFEKNQVFEGAIVDPCLIVLEKNKLKKENKILFNYKNKISQNSLNEESWSFEEEEKIKILEKIKQFKELKNWDIKIKYGIKTGLNEAFIIDEKIRKNFIKENSKNNEIIKPLLRGRDLGKYFFKNPKLYLLNISNRLNLNNFKEIKNHLEFYKERLSKRKNIKNWFELQSFPSEENKKIFENKNFIAWLELTDKPKFNLVNNFYILNSITFMDTKKQNSLFFLSILNSKLIEYFFNKICLSSGVGTNQWRKNNVEKIPIPEIPKNEQTPFIEKANLMLKLNKNFYDKINFYLESLKIDLKVEKVPKKLEKFYLLEKNEFLKELKKISNKNLEKFFSNFEEDSKKILEIKNTIEKEDKIINNMVYELYNLTKDEIKLIEEN